MPALTIPSSCIRTMKVTRICAYSGCPVLIKNGRREHGKAEHTVDTEETLSLQVRSHSTAEQLDLQAASSTVTL